MQALAELERVPPALDHALTERHGRLGREADARGLRRAEGDDPPTQRRHQGRIAGTRRGGRCAGFAFAALKGTAWVVERGRMPRRGGRCSTWTCLSMRCFDDFRYFSIASAMCGFPMMRAYYIILHDAPYARSDGVATLEAHRYLGWRHWLLAPGILFDRARPVAAGLLLPAPCCRAFHAIIHWQIEEFGISRATMPLKDVPDIDCFLARSDVDWAALAAHAKRRRCTGGLRGGHCIGRRSIWRVEAR